MNLRRVKLRAGEVVQSRLALFRAQQHHVLKCSADCVLGINKDLTGVVDPIDRNGATEVESRIRRNQRIEIDPDAILKDARDGFGRAGRVIGSRISCNGENLPG